MSDCDYEYDSVTDSDEESVGCDFFWKEMAKRIYCSHKDITITLEENDDVSVLDEILRTIQDGVSAQFILTNVQIENTHNAIINNPTKRKGPQRLTEIIRLQSLLKPELYIKNITKLHIPNAEDYETLPELSQLKELILGRPTASVLRKLCSYKKIEALELSDINIVPHLFHFKKLKVCTLKKIKRFRDSSVITLMPKHVDIYVEDSVIWPSDAIMLGFRQNININNIMVNDGKLKTYKEWKEGNKKPIIF